MTKIVIDTRERLMAVRDMFSKQRDFEVEVRKLEVGDIEFGNLIIERKSATDLLNSVRDERFWRNLFTMQENYDHVLVWVDASRKDLRREWKFRKGGYLTYFGILATLAYHQIPYCQFESRREAELFFLYLFRKLEKSGRNEPPARVKKRGRSLDELRIECLRTLPGVGFKKARAILSQYGSIASFVDSLDKTSKYHNFFYGEYEE
ncbi:MAG: ERCC4 domain-containing protein [Methanosarcinales archaeon]